MNVLFLRTVDPLRLLAILLIGGGVVAWMRSGEVAPNATPACENGEDGCAVSPPDANGASPEAPPTLRAQDFCTDVGYLCAGLTTQPSVQLRRWSGLESTLVVHIPPPEGLESGTARALQRAASQGVRAWNNQPFPILVDLRGDREAHVAVQWSRYMTGTQLGVTRTTWSRGSGLTVDFIELGTLSRRRPGEPADPRQVRLTAAHEMGHALGLPHSDSPRDVMYPTNTATSMSAQDYRTVEVLYGLPDGTSITR